MKSFWCQDQGNQGFDRALEDIEKKVSSLWGVIRIFYYGIEFYAEMFFFFIIYMYRRARFNHIHTELTMSNAFSNFLGAIMKIIIRLIWLIIYLGVLEGKSNTDITNKVYDHQLVRTDSRERKLQAFFSPVVNNDKTGDESVPVNDTITKQESNKQPNPDTIESMEVDLEDSASVFSDVTTDQPASFR